MGTLMRRGLACILENLARYSMSLIVVLIAIVIFVIVAGFIVKQF